jgi:hypothetical protein
MEELFYETDNEIELYREDAMDQDRLFENTDIDSETMDSWYETRKQRIYDTYTKEYEGYEEGCTYFFGCSLNSYKHNYEKRKKTFLEGFQDYDVYDFLRHEFDQGVFVYNRSYMEPKMMNKIEASLRKRFYFLREQAEMHGYEVSVLDDSSVRLAIKAEQKGGKEQNDLNEDNDEPLKSKANIKILFLSELGVIDFLIKQIPFNSSSLALSKALSHVTGEGAMTLNRYILPLQNSSSTQDRNPRNNQDNLDYVKSELNSIGFR